MSIVIGADLVPTQSNFELFNNGNAKELVGEELLSVLSNADYRVFNLELPLTDKESPIEKAGPNLIAPKSTINGYKTIGVDLLTIANNHILDQGEQGFFSTINLLDENNIKHVGGGENLKDASKPFIKEINGKKIGFYACAEHEFSIATEKTCGANPFDPLESLDHIVELKKQCDYVVVLYHGGKEHYRYPSPNLQNTCRKLVEKGANLVICQHSHCIGCREDYKNGTIVYGQGNFLFDHNKSEFWQTSLLIKVNDDFSLEYIPLVKQNEVVRLAEGEKAKEIIDGFNLRSEEIKQEGFIEKKYDKFSKELLYNYLYNFSGKKHGFFAKVLNKLTRGKFYYWRIDRIYKKKRVLSMINHIECEAHREILLKGLQK